MNDSFFGESICIHAVLIRSNIEEEVREALSLAELSKPASVVIYRNRGATPNSIHPHNNDCWETLKLNAIYASASRLVREKMG